MEEEDQVSVTDKMMRSCQILERMVTQNSYTEIAEDFKFYEDPADEFKVAWSTLIGLGSTLLRSHWSRASLVMLAPAVLCHKETDRRIHTRVVDQSAFLSSRKLCLTLNPGHQTASQPAVSLFFFKLNKCLSVSVDILQTEHSGN